MDLLIKKNVLKKDKVLVDIDKSQIKLLGIHYSGGKVSVSGSYAVDMMKNPDIGEIAGYINNFLRREKVIKKSDIILSIPSTLVQYRIEFVKNIKMSALDKHVRTNNKIGNEHTHIIDWTYLGERVENGDTLKYYMIAAVKKSSVIPFITEFAKQKLNVTEITFLENNMVCLADLYKNDTSNKLYINFGKDSTVVLVENGGTFIYSRVIDYDFDSVSSENSLQNEILRVIQMCENDSVEINRIISVGDISGEFLSEFVSNGIDVEIINENQWNEVKGSGYILSFVGSEVEGNFSPEIGASLSAVQNHKRLNLMPTEYKEKQINKYLVYSFGTVLSMVALIIAISYANLVIANYTLNKLRADDSEYNQKLSQIEGFEVVNKNSRKFIDDYERMNFPFYNFMQFVQYNKPGNLTIISVDSVNKLIPKTEVPESADETEKEESFEDSDTNNESAQNVTLQYTKDLLGEKLSIRGYSIDSSDISDFLYDLSKIPYIADLELKAIEENKIGGSDIVLFEAIVTFGGGESLVINE